MKTLEIGIWSGIFNIKINSRKLKWTIPISDVIMCTTSASVDNLSDIVYEKLMENVK